MKFLSASQPEATRDTVLTILIDDISHTAFSRLKGNNKNQSIRIVEVTEIERYEAHTHLKDAQPVTLQGKWK